MHTRRPVTRRKGEGGFALLLIFLLAASVSIMLLMQLPRVAFESQRDKEQLLVDRGEQYKRAIQLYYFKTKKFPQTIEDLENTNNVRFLRRRYIDPMTGKDEWRVIHVNAAGLLTDSLVEKPPSLDPSKDKDKDKTELATANPADGSDLNPLARQRPSDRTPGAVTGFPGGFPVAPTDPNAPPSSFADPNQPNGQPGQFPPNGFPVNPNGQTGVPGAPPQPGTVGYPNPAVPGSTQGLPPGWQPGQPLPPGVVPVTGVPQGGFPGSTGQPVGYPGAPTTPPVGGLSPFQPGSLPFSQPGQTGSPTSGGFGTGGAAPPNPALNLINQIITTPRQNPTQPTSNSQNQFGAGGIAGFASTFKGTGIKLYKDHKKYQEWEFVFDLKELLGQQNQGTKTNNNPLGKQGSSQSTTGATNSTGTSNNTSNNNGFTFGGGQGTPPPRP